MSFLPCPITAGIMCCWIVCAPTVTIFSELAGGVKAPVGRQCLRTGQKMRELYDALRKNRNG